MDSSSAGAAGAAAGMFGMMSLVWLAVVILMIAGAWKVFDKAGRPGWAAIIPIYNIRTFALLLHNDIVMFGVFGEWVYPCCCYAHRTPIH